MDECLTKIVEGKAITQQHLVFERVHDSISSFQINELKGERFQWFAANSFQYASLQCWLHFIKHVCQLTIKRRLGRSPGNNIQCTTKLSPSSLGGHTPKMSYTLFRFLSFFGYTFIGLVFRKDRLSFYWGIFINLVVTQRVNSLIGQISFSFIQDPSVSSGIAVGDKLRVFITFPLNDPEISARMTLIFYIDGKHFKCLRVFLISIPGLLKISRQLFGVLWIMLQKLLHEQLRNYVLLITIEVLIFQSFCSLQEGCSQQVTDRNMTGQCGGITGHQSITYQIFSKRS